MCFSFSVAIILFDLVTHVQEDTSKHRLIEFLVFEVDLNRRLRNLLFLRFSDFLKYWMLQCIINRYSEVRVNLKHFV